MATAPSPPRPKDLIANRVNLYIYHGKTSRAHTTQIRSREGPFSPHGGLRGGSGTQGNSLASKGEREWQQTRRLPFCCSTSLISLLTSMRVDGDEENGGKEQHSEGSRGGSRRCPHRPTEPLGHSERPWGKQRPKKGHKLPGKCSLLRLTCQ